MRSLGRAGLTVHLAAWEGKRVARSSRYVSHVIDMVDPTRSPGDFTPGLIEHLQDWSYDLVLPVTDKCLVPLVAAREEVTRHCLLAIADDAGFAVANDKAATVRMAEDLAIAVPPSLLIRSRLELEGARTEYSFLKPVSSHTAAGGGRHNVRVASNRAELDQRGNTHRSPDDASEAG